jgi:5'-3' exonuclease
MAAKEDFPNAMLRFVISLRAKKIHPIFVFDGKAPPEKEDERKRRADARAKQVARVERLEEAIRVYETTEELSEELENLNVTNRRLLTPSFDLKAAKEHVRKLRYRLFDVGEEDFVTLKTILDLTKTPRIQAEGEAEALCAQLVKKGVAKAALTKDTDVLTHGCPLVFNKINYHDETFNAVCLESILDALELTYDQWVDLCIMCGTDYNKNIPMIGPHKAYDLIKKHGSLEEVSKTLSTEILNYKRVRELFKEVDEVTSPILFATIPNYPGLHRWMTEHKIKMSVSDIRRRLETNPKKK